MNSEVKVICPRKFVDERGYFSEVWNKKTLFEEGIDVQFVQDNISLSINALMIRGLHFQKPPYAQAKLLRCIKGKVMDIAVDIRKGSPTYGKHIAVELSGENKRQLFIPKGMAHGFSVLKENTVFAYKVDNIYIPEYDSGIRYDDKDLDLDWCLNENEIILSAKDQNLPCLKDFDSPFNF